MKIYGGGRWGQIYGGRGQTSDRGAHGHRGGRGGGVVVALSTINVPEVGKSSPPPPPLPLLLLLLLPPHHDAAYRASRPTDRHRLPPPRPPAYTPSSLVPTAPPPPAVKLQILPGGRPGGHGRSVDRDLTDGRTDGHVVLLAS